MAKFLFFPFSNQLGTTIPSITLARLLKDQGHEVVFAAGGKYVPIIKEKGFPVLKINEISYKQYREHIDNNNLDFYNRHLIRHMVDMELDIISEVEPDVVVQHNRQTVYISSKVAGKPLVALTVACLTKYYGDRYYIPDNHPISKLLPFIDLNKILPERTLRRGFNISAIVWARGFNQVLERYGLPRVKNFLDLNYGDLTLLVETFGLSPVKELPDDVLFLEQDIESTFGEEYEWFEEIKQAKSKEKKVIYVTMGTSSFESYPLVVDIIADFVLHNENYILVSNHCGLDAKYKNCNNIYIEEYIDTKKIIEYVDVVVTHGGKNTLNECLIYKKPVVVVPEQAEQFWNGKYIERLGLGRVISRIKLVKNHEILLKTINQILTDTSYHENFIKFINRYIEKIGLVNHKEKIIKQINTLI